MIDTIELTMPAILKAARTLWDRGELQIQLPEGGCSYSGPCVVGSVLTPEQRCYLDHNYGGATTTSLVANGAISFPDQVQAREARQLQVQHDEGHVGQFLETLTEFEGKYAAELAA